MPHTGPTGGGDSKVDSETYPVADALALSWYSGLGRESSQERWAFAFSAKADWRGKVKSDIDKIAHTQRGYVKAFFVTNQAVPDKQRAEIEDNLKSAHGIEVRIFDRNWILDRVFTGSHEDLAIHELGVTALSRRDVKKGPLDVQREGELQELERRIEGALREGVFSSALVDDALNAADLARNLERSRPEVEGRYVRADQLALKYGSVTQQIEAAYQHSWTLYWWFEDYIASSEKYSVVEERAKGSRNAYHLEHLTTLWTCLHWAVARGDVDAEFASHSTRTHTLLRELERLQEEKDRPSTALQAETLLLQTQLARRLYAKESIEDVLRSLQDVILRSEGLVGYPLEPLVDSLTEIGPLLEGVTGYDEFFDTIVRVVSTRDGDMRAARLLLKRGEQQFAQNLYVEAIATLGQTLGRLYKHESRREIVRALYLCSCAYDEIGLPWAARGTLISAASIATNELWQYGEVTPYQAACYRRLKWIELRLGRLPHVLAWHELDITIRHELANRGYDREALFSDEIAFSALLGRLLLRTDFFDLKALEKLPDVLDRLGLDQAADVLLFALGHEDRFNEMSQRVGVDPLTFVAQLRNLRADIPLPDGPILYDRRKVSLESHVLGCRIVVECKMDSPCLEVAESMLATLESFLATSALDRAFAREPEFSIEVRTSDFAEAPISVSVEEREGRPHIVVRCQKFDPHAIPIDKQVATRDAIFHAVVTILTQFVVFKDFEQDLETLFRDERVSERAVAFTSTLGVQSNVLGLSPKTQLTSWIDEEAQSYALRRDKPFELAETSIEAKAEDEIAHRLAQPTELPPTPYHHNLRSHDEIETVSLIRERLWDRAGWTGTVFLTDPTNQALPVFGLVFRDRDAGREIFAQWQRELGRIDKAEHIRIVVVRGIDKAHPYAYRVTIGSNPAALRTGKRFISFVHRINRMAATSPENLDRFLSAHAALGALYLAPAFAPGGFDAGNPPEVEMDLCIAIHAIHMRNAWEVGLNDIDAVAITEGDDPIVPEGIVDPPVSKLLRKRRSISASK